MASTHTADQSSDGMVAGRKPTCDETEQCDGMVAGRKPAHDETEQCDGMVAGRKPTHDETEQCDGMVGGRKPTHDETEQCDGMVVGRKPTCDDTEPCDGMVAGRRPTRDETEQCSHSLHLPLNMAGLSSEFMVVVAIDIGTDYTGYAFSFRDNYQRDPPEIHAKRWSNGFEWFENAPTCVLFDPQMRFSMFGYDAENKYKSLADGNEEDQEHRKWFFFRRFKMTLFDKMKLQGQCMLDDETGKKMPALDVFSAVIEYLKNDFYQQTLGLVRNDVRWVLTVPAIWTDACKQFMREAANKAGIINDNLLIVLQSEAALMYFRTLPRQRNQTGEGSAFELVPGSKYMVFDASDGIEYSCITVQKIEASGHSRRLYARKWGNQGGIGMDQAFTNFLASIAGNNIMDNLKMNNTLDYFDLLHNFQMKMRELRTEGNGAIRIIVPGTLLQLFKSDKNQAVDEFVAAKYRWISDKFEISAATAKDIFNCAYKSILKHLDTLCSSGVLDNVSTILMVGKCLAYPMLQEMIKGRFKDKTIIIPEHLHRDIAVLMGAVMLGHNPTLIAEERCCKT